MKKAVCFAMVLAMLALMALGGCTAGEKELRKVKLNEVTRSVFYAPLYCAVTLGYFEKEGMEVEIVTSGGSDKSMTALISGDADVALMGPETGIYVVNQGLEGHPMIVAQITKRDGSFLVGRNDIRVNGGNRDGAVDGVGEGIGNHNVHGQQELDALGLGLGHHVLAVVNLLIVNERSTNL